MLLRLPPGDIFDKVYKCRSEREFRAAVDRYIDFYNTQRPHKTIHYKTPQAKEEAYAKTHKTEASNGAE